jgi:hypothetical protein
MLMNWFVAVQYNNNFLHTQVTFSHFLTKLFIIRKEITTACILIIFQCILISLIYRSNSLWLCTVIDFVILDLNIQYISPEHLWTVSYAQKKIIIIIMHMYVYLLQISVYMPILVSLWGNYEVLLVLIRIIFLIFSSPLQSILKVFSWHIILKVCNFVYLSANVMLYILHLFEFHPFFSYP